jgi:E3 SUMO-protein ligase PIAS1
MELLATHFQPDKSNFEEFYKASISPSLSLSLSLSRGTDYVIANGETPPPKPLLMKQMYERNTDDEPLSLAGVMVLAITLKNACQFGWFRENGAEQVLTIVDEIKKRCTAP